jgi:hypothetical protein
MKTDILISVFFLFNSFFESCIAVCLKQKKKFQKFLRIDRRDTILSMALYDSFFILSSLFIVSDKHLTPLKPNLWKKIMKPQKRISLNVG